MALANSIGQRGENLTQFLTKRMLGNLQGYYFKRSFGDAVRGWDHRIEGYIDRALTLKEIEDWKKSGTY